MKNFYILMLGFMLVQCSDNTPVTVNKNASPEAHNLLEFLMKISVEQRLSGQHN